MTKIVNNYYITEKEQEDSVENNYFVECVSKKPPQPQYTEIREQAKDIDIDLTQPVSIKGNVAIFGFVFFFLFYLAFKN